MQWILIILFLATVIFRLWLRRLNLLHLSRHGHEIPRGFSGVIDPGLLRKTTDYTIANSQVALIESLFGSLVLVIFIFCGPLEWYDRWVESLTGSFIGQGVLFVVGLILAQTLLDIPFSLYRTFVLEERFQFNVSTAQIWVTDLVKSLMIGIALVSLVTAGALALVQASPASWWIWVWGFLALVTLVLMYLSPVLIEPLFFKFEPLCRESLGERVKEIMGRAGLRVESVQQVDASRRSRHSNAYFTGIGRVKRIVLFDTLLEQMEDDEIVGVLAHEAGHWKLGHIWKRLLGMELFSLLACWAVAAILSWGELPILFGLEKAGFVTQVLLCGFLFSLLLFPMTPAFSALSRRHEYQADRFAVELTGRPSALAQALAKLARENLSNLHPHPFYAWFYYSHPPVVQRLACLIENKPIVPD